MEQKLREMWITSSQLQTRTCEAEEDGDPGQNRSPIFESLQLDTLFFPLMFVSSRVRDFLDTGDTWYSMKRVIANDDVPADCFLFLRRSKSRTLS